MPDPTAAPAATPTPVVVLVRDLILGSRIAATAEALGTPLRTVRDPAKLAEVAGDHLIVDLNLAGAVDAAAAWRAAGRGRTVLGFVSHVDAETIACARRQGVDRVMARGRFAEDLPRLLAGGGGPATAEGER